jgi:hypothetical protein
MSDPTDWEGEVVQITVEGIGDEHGLVRVRGVLGAVQPREFQGEEGVAWFPVGGQGGHDIGTGFYVDARRLKRFKQHGPVIQIQGNLDISAPGRP